MNIDVFGADEQQDHTIDLDYFTRLLAFALAAEGVEPPAEVNLLFVDQDAIAALNESHMGKSGPTDVLSFPIDDEPIVVGQDVLEAISNEDSDAESPRLELRLVGDIVIAPSIAAQNARDHEVTLEEELRLLVVHGALHLLGWDHLLDEDAQAMEAREQMLLREFEVIGESL